MPVPPKKTKSLGILCHTLEELAISSEGINRDELLRILKDVRADQESLWQAQLSLREELLREIDRLAPNQSAPDKQVMRLAGQAISSIEIGGPESRVRERAQLSAAASSVNTPSENMTLQPRICGVPQFDMKHGPHVLQPPTAVWHAREPLPPSPQMLQEPRSTPFEAVEVQSHDFHGESVNKIQGTRSAEIEAPTALNARARKQARRASLADGADGYWEFRSSCWDVSSLLGHRQSFQDLEALGNALLLSISIVVQGLFIIILFRLAGTTFDEATIEGYHKWRTVTGHAVQYMDDLTEESLATRVCSGDASLHISNTQAAQVQNIDRYLRNHAPFNGPMMCVLALLIWILTVSTEFHGLLTMLRACMGIPRGETVIAAKGNSIQLCSLSFYRLVYIILLVILRAIIAGGLLVAGVKFLIVTTAIEDILLNTVALEFILEIDELLFAALAPRQTRMFVLWMNPLPVKGGSWKGLDADFFAIALTVIGVFSVAIPAWLLPEMQRMRRAEKELCGGLIGFSYSVSTVNSVAWDTENMHNSPDQVWQQSKRSSWYTMLRSVIENRYESDIIATHTKTSGLQGGVWSVDALQKQDMVGLGFLANRGCADVLQGAAVGNATQVGAIPYVALVSLRDSFGNQSISSCAEVALHCNNEMEGAARMMCPKTCGCDSPSSGLALPFPNFGCPTSCFDKADFVSALTKQPCVDQPKHVLIQDASWQKLASNLRQTVTGQSEDYRNVWASVSKLMLESGCGAIARAAAAFPTAPWLDLCYGDRKPVQFWCPVSCNCSWLKPNPNLCPRSC